MKKYICRYEFQSAILTVEADELDKLKYGFFIDNQNRFTEVLDLARYWIVPSQITYIKIEEE